MASGAGASGWHPEDIKAALRKQHGPITLLSVAWGYSRTAITNTLTRPDYSAVIEQRIALALGKKPHTLWPDRWTPTGEQRPRPITIAAQATRAAPTPHRQKRGAA